MLVRHEDEGLERLEADASFDAGLASAVVAAFRKRMQYIRAAVDERDFRAMKSLHFEKLRGDREGQYSMRLNDQWRLIVTLEGEAPEKVVVIVEVVDYH